MAKLLVAPSREILEAALSGLEAQREKLNEQISQVQTMLGGKTHKMGRPSKHVVSHSAGPVAVASATNKRILSPEARKRIATAQKKRWAAFRKTQG